MSVGRHRLCGSVCLGSLISLLIVASLSLACFYPQSVPENSDIVGLTWPEGPYKIYSLRKDGLYTQYSDGTGKQLIHASDQRPYQFLLIDSSRQILLLGSRKILLLQGDGSIVRTLFTVPQEKGFWGWFLSPDRSRMVVVLADRENWRARHEPYLVDILTGDSRHLGTVGRDWNFNKLKHIRWSKDSYALLLTARSFGEVGSLEFEQEGCNFATYDLIRHVTRICVNTGYGAFQETVTPNPNLGMYPLTRSGSRSATRTARIKDGASVYIDDVEVLPLEVSGDKDVGGCFNPNWLPDDEHLVVVCGSLYTKGGIRIIEASISLTATKQSGLGFRRMRGNPCLAEET